MTITIYVHPKLHEVEVGAQINSEENYVVHYGAIEIFGADKWDAIKKMVRELRRLNKIDGLSHDLAVPDAYSDYDKCIISSDLIEQEVADPIDKNLIEKVA